MVKNIIFPLGLYFMQRSDTFHFLRMKKFSVFLHGVIQYQWMFESQDIKQNEDHSEKVCYPQIFIPNKWM